MIFRILLACCLVTSLAPASAAEPAPSWPFFPFDNGVGRGVWTPEVQAKTVKELGYDGIHYNYTNPGDFAKKLAACRHEGVPIHAVYIYTFVDKLEQPYDPGIKEVIRMLKGEPTTIWLTLRGGKPGALDARAAAITREITLLAAGSGLSVSLYPHAGFYVATAEDAVRVAKLVDLPNLGVTVNLCHELFAGNADRLDEVVKIAAPYLNLVSINGASPIPGKGAKAWNTLALGDGTFDTTGFLRMVRDAGYNGPIGHQFYNVPGDDREKLERAARAWKAVKPTILEQR
jgi:sugar phosphate isomerase/epimerase